MSTIMLMSAGSYLVLLLVLVRQIKICKRGEPIALLTIAIHGVIYYGVLISQKISGTVDPQFWNTWSSALRLHGILTIAAVEIIRWRRLEQMKHGCE